MGDNQRSEKVWFLFSLGEHKADKLENNNWNIRDTMFNEMVLHPYYNEIVNP